MFSGRPIEDFLKSLGFVISLNDRGGVGVPHGYTIDQLIDSRHHRLKIRGQLGPEQYGLLFEKVVEQLLLGSFKFDVLRGVQFEDEGMGGDYDVLAFQSPHLHYIECKTTSDIKFKEIFARHKFLRPSLTLILVDRPKRDVADIVSGEINSFFIEDWKKRHPNKKIDFTKYPIEQISDIEAGFTLYHMRRNVFIASGEDIDKAIRKTLRYFHQVVQQSSYIS